MKSTNKFKQFLNLKREFGFKHTFKFFKNNFLYKLTKNIKYKKKVHSQISNYVWENYKYVFKPTQSTQKMEKDYKIWVFWWQGQEKMPDIVKKSVSSIQSNFQKNEVIIIDKNNFRQYVEIPSYIIEKVEKGIITLTHFSDIMRASLLTKFGGVWMDSTIYLNQPIDVDIEKYKFYSNKLDPQFFDGRKFVSEAKWSAFFLAGTKNNIVFSNLRDVLYEYWKTHNVLVEYFLIDYIIDLCYQHFDSAKQMIDSVPFNNQDIYYIAEHLFEKVDLNKLDNICKNTKMFKLTYKFQQDETLKADTYYKYIMEK